VQLDVEIDNNIRRNRKKTNEVKWLWKRKVEGRRR